MVSRVCDSDRTGSTVGFTGGAMVAVGAVVGRAVVVGSEVLVVVTRMGTVVATGALVGKGGETVAGSTVSASDAALGGVVSWRVPCGETAGEPHPASTTLAMKQVRTRPVRFVSITYLFLKDKRNRQFISSTFFS